MLDLVLCGPVKKVFWIPQRRFDFFETEGWPRPILFVKSIFSALTAWVKLDGECEYQEPLVI